MPTVNPNTPYSRSPDPYVEPIDINRDGHLDAADGVVDERDLLRHADDGGRELRVEPVNGPFDDGDAHPIEVNDDEYFAAPTGDRAAASDAHGRASTAPAQGTRGAALSNSGLRAVEDDSAIQREGFGRPARLTSDRDEPTPHDAGNGASDDPALVSPAPVDLTRVEAKPGANWRTAAWGMLLSVGIAMTQIGPMLIGTDDPTLKWFGVIVSMLGAAMLGIDARSKKTSDQDSGARPRTIVDDAIAQRSRAASLADGTTRLVPVALALVATLAVVGCASVAPDYVRADRSTYETIAPYVRDLADGKLTSADIDPDERQSLEDKLGTWDLRIRGAEQGKSSGE